MARNGINKRELDKWAKNFVKESNKSLERAQRQNPLRVSAQLNATASVSAVPGAEAIEGSGLLARLLLWLDVRAQQNPHYINVSQFLEEAQLPDEDPSVLAFELEQRDLVKVLRNWGGPHEVHLTDAGRAAIHRMKKLRLDRAARLRYTMDAFHRWLFDTAADPAPVAPELFLTTHAAYFAGSEITETELDEALAHLTQYELVEYLDTEPVTVAITPQGASCALTGGSVQDHINQPRSGTTYNNYLPNAKGVIIGEQQHFTQNNTDGIDPTLFVQLAGYIGQVSPILGLPETDRVELERVAQDLHDEATSDNPEQGRLRQFATQLKDKLLEGATTMAATQGIQMAEQALTTLM
ncbi:hypothetical protein I6J42_34745 (plasmid) [Streptomyces californicus]|uniref:Uncharacterized protein n=1 Tax=Streptomyces californicus TaxID=67351 RepID=A0ABD7D6Y2_9ACTN|nr:hypothetical protein [Streptomyces californicus]QRV39227.1 hypothetical protein I6J42_34745 [Streptomyces californicus]QRV52679.1 hypothetical protein I6J43_34765 [Streptomyces californicus]